MKKWKVDPAASVQTTIVNMIAAANSAQQGVECTLDGTRIVAQPGNSWRKLLEKYEAARGSKR